MRKSLMALVVVTMWVSSAAAQTDETFRGRVVAGIEASEIMVSMERQGGQILAQVMTDSRGSFVFRNVASGDRSNANYVYLIVAEEGFKPYRERLDGVQIRGGGAFTIYLEPEDGTNGGPDGTAIDVRQLLVEIPEEAIEEYEKALEDIEDDDHEDAIERLERAVELAPDYYDAWIDLGSQHSALGATDNARDAYQQALEVNPNGSLAHLNLGALDYQEGERHAAAENAIEALGTFAEARASLERAIQLDPLSADARFYLGATLYRMTLYDESEAMLQSVIDMEGQHAQTRLTLINVYARMQRYVDAVEQANAFLEENEDAPEREAIERVKAQLEDVLSR